MTAQSTARVVGFVRVEKDDVERLAGLAHLAAQAGQAPQRISYPKGSFRSSASITTLCAARASAGRRRTWCSCCWRLSEAGAEHLKALARISRLLRDKATCGKLRGANSADALYALLTEGAAG